MSKWNETIQSDAFKALSETPSMIAPINRLEAGEAVAWRTVPVEPTAEMRIAGVQAWRDDEWEAPVSRIWSAMLAAAPLNGKA